MHAKQSSDQRQTTIELANLLLERDLASVAGRAAEVTALPLLSEFFTIVATDPDGVDAKELRAYLGDVFARAREDLDAETIAAVAPDGTVLLSMPEQSSVPKTDTQLVSPGSALLSGESPQPPNMVAAGCSRIQRS